MQKNAGWGDDEWWEEQQPKDNGKEDWSSYKQWNTRHWKGRDAAVMLQAFQTGGEDSSQEQIGKKKKTKNTNIAS